MKNQGGFIRARFAVVAFFVVFLACFSVCRADDFGDISITADAMYTGNTFHGYAARRITLENRSDRQSHVVTLDFPDRSFSNYGSSISRLSRTVTLAPGATEMVTLLQPPLPVYGDDSITVTIDGDHAGDIRAPNPNSHCANNYYPGKPATAFISRTLNYDAVCHVLTDSPVAPGSYSYGSSFGGYGVEGLRAEVPVSEWSTDWLAYTPFDVVVIDDTDVPSMSPEVAAALDSYIHAGGTLIVFGSDGVPDSWRAGAVKPLKDGKDFAAGLGDCYVLDSENPARLDAVTISALRSNTSGNARYWQSLPNNSDSMNESLHLVDNLKIPTRGIISLMLLFVVVIGPVNIIVLNRRKHRTWLLWTIPAISVATTLMVFAYSLLREGITPTVRITGLTVLDQTSHHAETIGAEGIYCPLTPSGGLHFDAETEVTPLVNFNYSSGATCEIDWSQGQHFTRGWVAARVPAFFHLRKSETCRDRVQVENKDGRLQVLNGLGAPIKLLWYADAAMNMYVARDVPAGAYAQLKPIARMQSRSETGPAALFRDIGFVARTDSPENYGGVYLMPETYIAILNSNPFIEDALGPGASRKLTETSAVVFGFLDPADKL